jgi:SagB-type dehydrogenase family enzyme
MTTDLKVLRPVPPGSRDHDANAPIEMVRPHSGKRLKFSRSAALEYLYGGDHAAAIEKAISDTAEPNDTIEHWFERNWSWSAPYYLASRRQVFADERDHDATVRNTTLREYLDESPPPGVRETRNNWTPLGDDDEPEVVPTLGEVLAARRTRPRPTKRQLSLRDLSWILRNGFRLARNSVLKSSDYANDPVRLLVSFGCAVDAYVVVYDVDGLEPGLYAYSITDHAISLVRAVADVPALREQMQRIMVGQPAPLTAAATVMLVADFARYQWRYRHERALRQLYVDSGHLLGYVLLAATALRKGTHISPATMDSAGLDFLERDRAKDQVLHSISFS